MTFKLVKKKTTLLYSNNMPGIAEKVGHGLNTVNFLRCEDGMMVTQETVTASRGMRKDSGEYHVCYFQWFKSNATKRHMKQIQQETNC